MTVIYKLHIAFNTFNFLVLSYVVLTRATINPKKIPSKVANIVMTIVFFRPSTIYMYLSSFIRFKFNALIIFSILELLNTTIYYFIYLSTIALSSPFDLISSITLFNLFNKSVFPFLTAIAYSSSA